MGKGKYINRNDGIQSVPTTPKTSDIRRVAAETMPMGTPGGHSPAMGSMASPQPGPVPNPPAGASIRVSGHGQPTHGVASETSGDYKRGTQVGHSPMSAPHGSGLGTMAGKGSLGRK